jgi:VWFA-related protein
LEMRFTLSSIVAVLGFVSLSGLAASQDAHSGENAPPVTIPVTVENSKGDLISGLEAGDFRLFENGVEQKVMDFSADAQPLSIALVIDAALSGPTSERLRATFPSLLAALSESDEAGVFSFDVDFRTVAEFTSDKDKIEKALKQIPLGADYGIAGEPLGARVPVINGQQIGGAPSQYPGAGQRPRKDIDSALISALDALTQRPAAWRRIVLLVTDGLNSPHNPISASKVLEALQETDVTVYAIGLDSAKLPRGSGQLARFCEATGGELFKAVKKTSIENLYARITEQARYAYLLSYMPAGAAAGFRSIQVYVSKPHTRIIAREGYLAGRRPSQP